MFVRNLREIYCFVKFCIYSSLVHQLCLLSKKDGVIFLVFERTELS